MRNITHKPDSLRTAVAESFIVVSEELREVVASRKTEKGDALEIARVAAVMAAQKTWEIIPFCHQIPLTGCDVDYAFEENGIRISVRVATLAQTGAEMEAMTGASVCALTLYDMLKPYDARAEITHTRLLDKQGGKSDLHTTLHPPATTAVLVVCGRVHSGDTPDTAGGSVRDHLARFDDVALRNYEVLDDDPEALRARISGLIEGGTELLLTVGGTGVGVEDIVVDTLRPLFNRDLPGVMEAARSYGQTRTPRAMLSRGVAGLIADTLVVTVPGSTKGAEDTMSALFPGLLHAISVIRKDRNQ